MKKKIVSLTVVVGSVLLSGCGGLSNGSVGSTTNSGHSVLGEVIGSATNASTIGNVLSSVLGINNVSKKTLIGTWKYKGPGCAFTSDNTLAKAGGEVVASQIKEKLTSQYSKLGFSSSNTYITFNENGTFTAKIDGKNLSGKYTYDEKNFQLNMSSILLNLTAYTKHNTDGIAILFESKKILQLIQTLSALSGNETLGTIGNISKNYDGVRVGFDMIK